MAEIDDEKIRTLAYKLWQDDGSPEGRDHDYWHAAEKLLADEGEIKEPSVLETLVPIIPLKPRL